MARVGQFLGRSCDKTGEMSVNESTSISNPRFSQNTAHHSARTHHRVPLSAFSAEKARILTPSRSKYRELGESPYQDLKKQGFGTRFGWF